MTLTNLTHARDRIRRYLETRLTMLDTTALTQAFMQSQEDENLFKIYSEKKCDINNDPVKCAKISKEIIQASIISGKIVKSLIGYHSDQ